MYRKNVWHLYLSTQQFPVSTRGWQNILCWYGKSWIHFEHSKHTEQKPHRTWPVSTETFHEARIQEEDWMEVIRCRPVDSGSEIKGWPSQGAPFLPGSAALAPAPSVQSKGRLSSLRQRRGLMNSSENSRFRKQAGGHIFKDMYVILISELYYSCTRAQVSDFVSIQTKTNVKILKVQKETKSVSLNVTM